MLEVPVNNIEKNIDINIVHNSENFRSLQKFQGRERWYSRNLI